jgi:competence protein ComER
MTKSIGIIGTGHLGGMLIRGLINKKAVNPEQVYIYNRSEQKSQLFKEEFPQICLVDSNKELVTKADWIFLCVKPLDLPPLLAEIGTKFPPDKLIISTLLSPPLKELDNILEGGIVRIYPSVTQSTGYGITLAAFGRQVTKEEQGGLVGLLNHLGKTFIVPEEHFRPCGDITSCGPAFMAYMVGSLAEAAKEHGIDGKLAIEMSRETMLGTALLLEERQMTFGELVHEVATPGGCTEEGIKVLKSKLPALIGEVFKVTAAKEKVITAKIRKDFFAWMKKRPSP